MVTTKPRGRPRKISATAIKQLDKVRTAQQAVSLEEGAAGLLAVTLGIAAWQRQQAAKAQTPRPPVNDRPFDGPANTDPFATTTPGALFNRYPLSLDKVLAISQSLGLGRAYTASIIDLLTPAFLINPVSGMVLSPGVLFAGANLPVTQTTDILSRPLSPKLATPMVPSLIRVQWSFAAANRLKLKLINGANALFELTVIATPAKDTLYSGSFYAHAGDSFNFQANSTDTLEVFSVDEVPAT